MSKIDRGWCLGREQDQVFPDTSETHPLLQLETCLAHPWKRDELNTEKTWKQTEEHAPVLIAAPSSEAHGYPLLKSTLLDKWSQPSVDTERAKKKNTKVSHGSISLLVHRVRGHQRQH